MLLKLKYQILWYYIFNLKLVLVDYKILMQHEKVIMVITRLDPMLFHIFIVIIIRGRKILCVYMCVCANIYHRLILVFFIMHLREGSNKRSSRSSRWWKKGRKWRRNIFMTLRNFSKNNFCSRINRIIIIINSMLGSNVSYLYLLYETCRHAWIWELPQKNYIGKSKIYNLRKLERVAHQEREAIEGEM